MIVFSIIFVFGATSKEKQLLVSIPQSLVIKAQSLGFTHIFMRCNNARVNGMLSELRRNPKDYIWKPRYCKYISEMGLQFAEGGNEYFPCKYEGTKIQECGILNTIENEFEI